MPHSPHLPRRVIAALAAATVAATGLTFSASAAGAAEPSSNTDGASALGESRVVTLITGDSVEVSQAADGKRAATVTPGPGRERVTFQTIEVDGELQVLPSDAVPYLASGVLDADLFEVSTLIEEGYADLDALPLIVSWSSSAEISTMSITGATHTRALPSINGAALSAAVDDLDEVWQALTPGSTIATAPDADGADALQGDIDRVWLDGRASASLDHSVPQIGAPDAWEAGYRGEGVRVAVLDTGIDATHPDLVGQVEESVDFTESPSGAADLFGHGTHVAATIAGTGAGAGGARPGVAPDADLVIGKVLGDDGYGYDSWIIAGMEWAAERAPVVNMSLGGGASDGTDALSLALQSISEQTGALFVVAAGNDGADEAVATPSVAPAALSVAAVDRDESLADFSSRGPRTGNGGLKPEISAPGVAIVAARAAGTSMGSPVDALYTASSGTSMATPHVAGAAALLAQQHPDWNGERLKDALVSTARPNAELGVYEQGAGRVDVTRAVETQLTATGIADFGLQSEGQDSAVGERTVTYRNDGDEDLTLDLAIEMKNLDDAGSSGAAFSAPSSITVLAHTSADVTITLDQGALERGRWSGALVATASDGEDVRTAIGSIKRGPRHTMTIRAIGFDGEDTFVPVLTIFGDHLGAEALGWLGVGEVATVDLEEGDYIVQALIEGNSGVQNERTGTIILPEVSLTSDIEVVLDARNTRPIEIRTPEPAEQRSIVSWYTHRVFDNGRDIQHGVMAFERTAPWVTPTEPVRAGEFEFMSRWQLVRPSAYIQVPGTDLQPKASLLPESPDFDKPQRLELVAPGESLKGVRGKAVILDAPDEDAEAAQVEAAAAAGARAVILVRPERSIFTTFQPYLERGPIPAMVTTAADGAALIAQANRPGKRHVTIEASWTSPYLYDVIQVSPDAIPDSIVHEVTKTNTQRVTTTYVDNGGLRFAREQRFAWRPWMTYAWNDAQRTVATGESRVEWVSAGDSLWQHRVLHTWENWLGVVSGGMTGPVVSYKAGRSTERWFDPVVRPGAVATSPSTRTGDRMTFLVADMIDDAGHWSVGGVFTEARLFRDDELVETLPNARQSVDVAMEDAAYRLELDVAREDDDEWKSGVRSTTAWTFRSDRPAEGASTTLPLLQVAYDVPTDDDGSVDRRKHTIGLQVTDQLGAVTPGATVQLEVSYDDGEHWQELKVRGTKRGFTARVAGGETPVSLRVTASDGSSTVVQEVIRAYDRG